MVKLCISNKVKKITLYHGCQSHYIKSSRMFTDWAPTSVRSKLLMQRDHEDHVLP